MGDPAKVYSISVITPFSNNSTSIQLGAKSDGEFYTHLPIYSFHSLLIPYTSTYSDLRVLDSDTPTQKSIHYQPTSDQLQIPKHIPRFSCSFANQEIDTSYPARLYVPYRNPLIIAPSLITSHNTRTSNQLSFCMPRTLAK